MKIVECTGGSMILDNDENVVCCHCFRTTEQSGYGIGLWATEMWCTECLLTKQRKFRAFREANP